MSRIGKKPIPIPAGVEVAVSDGVVSVKGPKGSLRRVLPPQVMAVLNSAESGKAIKVSVQNQEEVRTRALWGLFRTLIANMVEGVTKGYEKKLEVIGVGYKIAGGGGKLTVDVGYSHPIEFALPAGINVAVEKNVITLSGADKELLGETAARIRRLRPPEPYKGKGIKYVGEVVRRKAGKTAKAAAK
ncbi:50S ribosomal protein L6 [Patescibacteria group bacterium]|nr:MAG: 50S ribosomal protein L6 [Patescibacteria group bacterium]